MKLECLFSALSHNIVLQLSIPCSFPGDKVLLLDQFRPYMFFKSTIKLHFAAWVKMCMLVDVSEHTATASGSIVQVPEFTIHEAAISDYSISDYRS